MIDSCQLPFHNGSNDNTNFESTIYLQLDMESDPYHRLHPRIPFLSLAASQYSDRIHLLVNQLYRMDDICGINWIS